MPLLHALPRRDEPTHRQSPHNIEVEQALLGAILINNEAFYRVSDFLEPSHFYDPLHRQIYEKAAQLIRLGKIADPRTHQELPQGERPRRRHHRRRNISARLAYEATTIINAEDYGRDDLRPVDPPRT